MNNKIKNQIEIDDLSQFSTSQLNEAIRLLQTYRDDRALLIGSGIKIVHNKKSKYICLQNCNRDELL